jgi:hypothetical protein
LYIPTPKYRKPSSHDNKVGRDEEKISGPLLITDSIQCADLKKCPPLQLQVQGDASTVGLPRIKDIYPACKLPSLNKKIIFESPPMNHQ